MNPSLLSVTPSSSSAAGAASPALLSPFLIRSNPSSLSLPSRRRLRVSFPRNSAASAVTVKPSDESASTATQPKPSIFGERKELTGIQPLVGSLPPPVRLTCSVIVLAGAVAAGYGLGQRFGGTRNLAIGGAAAMGAAGGAMVYALNACVPEVAATSLHNYVVGLDDPKGVEKDEIEQIVRKLVCLCLLFPVLVIVKVAAIMEIQLASSEFWGFRCFECQVWCEQNRPSFQCRTLGFVLPVS
ncbi:Protein TIC110, chloroplastic [Linum perenne]